MAVGSKLRVCDGPRGGIVGSNPAVSMSVPCARCVVRVHCVGLITRPEESYRVLLV